MNHRTLLWSLILLLATQVCVGQEITIAAAADLQSAMQELVPQFQRQTGKSVRVVYGSSGNFFQQIQNGAPFDMFFSANLDYPKKLESMGLADADSYFVYARGELVVWVTNDSKVNIGAGLAALMDTTVRKVAIANPQHAPYGQAAVAAMRKEGIYDKVKEKFVLGENVSQAASFVVTGAADIGVVALSLALAPTMSEKGRYIEIPGAEYPPIEQACVVITSTKNKESARQFLEFVKSAQAANTLGRYGFDVSDRDRK
jgi:molybdate transport system substrate-binding protein